MTMALLICMLFAPQGEAHQTLWEKANQAYRDGHYDEALAHYETLLEQGVHSGELHFNLGNAYFKNDQLGRAILHYAKARKYLPGDRDVEANLALADSRRIDEIEGEDEAFAQAFDNLARGLSYHVVYRGSLIFLLIGGLASLVLIARPRTGKWLGYVLVIGCITGLLLCGLAFVQYRQLTRNDMAVLVAEQIDVYAGPTLRDEVSFTVHEGLRCKILDEAEGWFRISLANGYNGWVPRTAIERI